MQIVANILVGSGTVVLLAVGFSLIFATARFFHFAHGATFAWGAYFAYFLTSTLRLPMVVSATLSVALCALLGCLMELSVYRPLRRRGAAPLVLLLASLGLYIALQNTIPLFFGHDTKVIRSSRIEQGVNVFGAMVTPVQVAIVLASIALVAATALFLRRTRTGIAIRAVANDPELASVSGVASERVMVWTFAVGSALAGVAGILVALDVDMTPTMGMNALMLAVVAVLIGGRGSFVGIALGALLLTAAQVCASLVLGAQWQEPIAFALLLAFLLVRPRGLFGVSSTQTVV